MAIRLPTAVQRAYTHVFLMLAIVPGVAAAQTPSHRPEGAADAKQVLSLQVGLDRAGFSPGEIDGQSGSKTRQATMAFQKAAGLHPDGRVSEETLAALKAPEPVTSYTIAEHDVAGPFIGHMPADMMDAARLKALGYTSPLEKIGEKFHSSPTLLRRLNPNARWTAGETIAVPNVEPFEVPARQPGTGGTKGTAGTPVEIFVSGATKSLSVRDASGKTLFYAPITIGSEKDPLPIGEWKVTGVSWEPIFNYNPALFWDADPSHAKAKIEPGPNNPVGVVWIDINKEHFGLHGTPEPGRIGRTESHGCIRLTNWDATKLARMVGPGTKVIIQ